MRRSKTTDFRCHNNPVRPGHVAFHRETNGTMRTTKCWGGPLLFTPLPWSVIGRPYRSRCFGTVPRRARYQFVRPTGTSSHPATARSRLVPAAAIVMAPIIVLLSFDDKRSMMRRCWLAPVGRSVGRDRDPRQPGLLEEQWGVVGRYNAARHRKKKSDAREEILE
jgi:hypothetical protein